MTEANSQQTDETSTAAVDERSEWRRPQLRRMPAAKAEKTLHGSDGGPLTS